MANTTLKAKLAAALCAVALWQGASAQDLIRSAPPQQTGIAITNARIHTMAGQVIERGHVMFQDGVITAVEAGDPPSRYAGVRIDAQGSHIYPGMIAASTRLGLIEISAVRATRDFAETGDIAPEVRAWVSVNPDSVMFPVTRSNGVLIAGSFPSGGLIQGQASVLRMDGWTTQDMTIEPSMGLVISWPQMRPVDAWWMDQRADEQRRRRDERLRTLNNFFDEAAAYDALRREDSGHPVDVSLEAMRRFLPTADNQLPVIVRCADVDQINAAVAWAAERDLRLIILGGRDAPLAADLLKEHDVPVIITGTYAFPKRDDSPYDDAFTLPLRLEEAGVRWCLAPKGGNEASDVRNLPYEAALAAAHGLDPEIAMKGVTIYAAEIMGIADRYGTIEPGKSATLIITDGNPLEMMTNVELAFIDGRTIDLHNKQRELRDKYREKYRQLGIIED